MNNGELTEEAITAELDDSDDVKFQLNDLVKLGVAKESLRNGKTVYQFENLQVKLVFKQCPYCGNDYPVRDDIQQCPSCGGDLKMHRSAIAGKNEKFSMDEDDDTGVRLIMICPK